MSGGIELIRWAQRVQKEKIRQLYEADARGVVDEDLIDEVGYAFLARCESIVEVTAAEHGRVRCPSCRTVIQRTGAPRPEQEAVRCPECGWQVTWRQYLSTYQHKQLSGGGGLAVFSSFAERWPLARTPQDKMLLIDWIVHQCHVRDVDGKPLASAGTRPVVQNLIEGTMTECVRFLDALSAGPARQDRRNVWREVLAESSRLFAERRRNTDGGP